MATISARLVNTVDWQPVELEHGLETDPGLPRTTHSGLIKAEEFELRCYKLADGQIGLDLEDIEGFFRGCLHSINPGPCLICQQADSSIDPIRLAVVLGNMENK